LDSLSDANPVLGLSVKMLLIIIGILNHGKFETEINAFSLTSSKALVWHPLTTAEGVLALLGKHLAMSYAANRRS
jgi:hypothetical protein